MLFESYEERVAALFGPVIRDICNNKYEDINILTRLIDLYVRFNQFFGLVLHLHDKALCQKKTDYKMNDFHSWFEKATKLWLEGLFINAEGRIQNSVKFDNLRPIDNLTKHSSSAKDTVETLEPIEIIWNQLKWPIAEQSFDFFEKIFDVLRKCFKLYVNTISLDRDIRGVFEQVVTKSATELFSFNLAVDFNEPNSDDNEQQLKQCIDVVIQLIRSDLQQAVKLHDAIFQVGKV